MRMSKRFAALVLAGAMTIAAIVVRAIAVPREADMEPFWYNAGYGLMALTLVVFGIIVVLVRPRSGKPTPELTAPRVNRRLLAFGAFVSGGVLVFSSLVDMIQWWILQDPPACLQWSRLSIVGVLMALQLLVGLAAGIALIALGYPLAQDRWENDGKLSWAMVLPVVWSWLRLARFESSFSAGMILSRSFFDIGLLIASMAFLLLFARKIAGVGKAHSPWSLVFAWWTMILSVSGSVVGRYLEWTGAEAYQRYTGWMADYGDLGVGILALCFAVAMTVPAPAPAAHAKKRTASSADTDSPSRTTPSHTK